MKDFGHKKGETLKNIVTNKKRKILNLQNVNWSEEKIGAKTLFNLNNDFEQDKWRSTKGREKKTPT